MSTDIYTLSLHDALPISVYLISGSLPKRPMRITLLIELMRDLDTLPTRLAGPERKHPVAGCSRRDRKSTRLNSSHVAISYDVLCLKKKSTTDIIYVDILV